MNGPTSPWATTTCSTQVGPRAWYAGALDYVSPNIWGELADEARLTGSRGRAGCWWTWTPGASERQPVPAARAGARPRADRRPKGWARAEVDAAHRRRGSRRSRAGSRDRIVRLRVYDVPRHVARELDHAAIRALKAEALHFHLDLRRPETQRVVGVGAPGRRQTLPELVAPIWLARPLPAEVDREPFVAPGVELMEAVERDLAAG